MVLEYDPVSEDDSQERYIFNFLIYSPVVLGALTFITFGFVVISEWLIGYSMDILKHVIAQWELVFYLIALERIRPSFIPLDDIGIND